MDQIVDFCREIFAGLSSGVLFFGGPADIARYVADILLITLILYNLLRILRETRAWQLLKGVLLIILLTMVCSLLGLEMVSFIFNKLLYIVALAFVVIFQPELRRALETVGLKSFSSISVAFTPEYQDPQHTQTRMIDEVVSACVKMGKTFTGALIIFERNSKLSELIMQENAVKLDSAVSDTMLQSIFYKGSPLHDGALLIRNGRIAAARCHIPLADNYHVSEELGTRHRAAIGASELGDAFAIAVSEERGTISIAWDGCLYTMQSGEDLRSNLRYLLGVSETSASLGQRIKSRYTHRRAWLRRFRKNGRKQNEAVPEDAGAEGETLAAESAVCSISQKEHILKKADEGAVSPVPRLSSVKAARVTKSQRVLMLLASLLISIGLWMYIQITNNPIAEKSLKVDVKDINYEQLAANGLDAYYPMATVTVTVIGRQTTIDTFTEADINAYVDYSGVASAGVVELPIKTSSDVSEYFRIEGQNPETISVVISKIEN